MASGEIGYAGSQLAMDGTARSINCTMSTTEYPTSVTFSTIGNGAYWYNNNQSSAKTLTLYLSNSSKSIVYTLGSVSLAAGGSNTTTKTFNVSCPNLNGYALYIYGSDGSCQLRNYCAISITTTYKAGKPSVSAGIEIRKTQMDALKAYLGRGTTVSQGGVIYASHGNTYKSGLTAGSTPINASWFNS